MLLVTDIPTSMRVAAALFGAICMTVCGCESRGSAPGSERFTLTVTAENDDPTRVTIVVRAADGAFTDVVGGTPPEGLVSIGTPDPLLGSWTRVTASEIEFEPAFPLLRGEEYEVRFDASRASGLGDSVLVKRYSVPDAPAATPPRVEALYPTSDLLPANHLKFYVVFSEPMQAGDIWERFRLIDLDSGDAVPRPFRHTELWSRDQKRLTLWFHPGRVKQGVNLNIEIGPILREGHAYRLSISGDWRSARGTPLGNDVAKEFRAGPPDHEQPNPRHWELQIPAAGTRAALRAVLGEPHDWALLHSDVAIVDRDGNAVAGTVDTDKDESVWVFTPRDPWQIGVLRLAVSSVLEDLAGNSVERPFEVDITENPAAGETSEFPETVYREFTVKR